MRFHFFFPTAQLKGHVVIWQRGKLSLLGRIKTATVKSLENTVGLDREIPEKSTWIGLEINAEQRASDDFDGRMSHELDGGESISRHLTGICLEV